VMWNNQDKKYLKMPRGLVTKEGEKVGKRGEGEFEKP